MRILTVSHSYPRAPGDPPGAFIERVLRKIQERGHAVRVVVPADQGKGGMDSVSGIPLRRMRYAPARHETLAYRGTLRERSLDLSGTIFSMSMTTSLAIGVLKESMTERWDLVHAHWWLPGGVAAWLARQLGAPPYIVTLHGTDVRMLERSNLFTTIGRSVLWGARSVTTVSSFLADRVAEITELPRKRIVVQPMPADVDRFTETSKGGAGLVTIGRLTRQKRMHLLIEALRILERDGVKVPLRIIGDGPEREPLERLARELEVQDQIEFTGEVQPAEVAALLGNADVCVFPAEGEGFGLGAAEALMAGIPVVAAADGGGVRDIVQDGERNGAGRGGLVVGPDPAEIAGAVRRLLSDQDSRARARLRGHSLRKELSAESVADRYEQIYESVAGSGRAAGA